MFVEVDRSGLLTSASTEAIGPRIGGKHLPLTPAHSRLSFSFNAWSSSRTERLRVASDGMMAVVAVRVWLAM